MCVQKYFRNVNRAIARRSDANVMSSCVRIVPRTAVAEVDGAAPAAAADVAVSSEAVAAAAAAALLILLVVSLSCDEI